tara:strand:- start:444 stop:1028 length:585 start_codon:yes stop_codon:yes gene_type:complete
MPGVANTNISIASNALVLIGASPIASFTDDDAGAIVADNVYDEIIEDCLTSHPWRFAIKQSDALNRLSSTPDTLWDAAYQVPTDSLAVRRVTVNDADITYEVYGDKIFCNAGSTDSVFLNYIYRADEADWPPYFRLGVQYKLAAVFALAVIQKSDLAKSYESKADFQMRKARNVDSQIDTVPTIETKRFITVRR